MKLAGYDFEGPFNYPSDVKDLPGVYVVLNFGVLDVGESGHRYREGGQGLIGRLHTNKRKLDWELLVGKGRGRASAWRETLEACDAVFTKESLVNKCRENDVSSRGGKKELCERLYKAGDEDVVDLMEKRLDTLREKWLEGHSIQNIAFAVHYEPETQKRLQIEEALRQHFFLPPCEGVGSDTAEVTKGNVPWNV